jgi:hypothetical protein
MTDNLRADWALIDAVRDRCYDLFVFDEKLRLHNLVCMFKSTRAISPNDRQWLVESADALRAMGAPAARTVRRRPPWLKRAKTSARRANG